MAGISAKDVMELRGRTGAGMMDCKKALAATGGDMDKAIDFLREKGLAAAAKKQSRIAAEGIVASYLCKKRNIGVLVEVNCETDFVAKTDEFQNLGHELCMQVAAAAPMFLTPEDVSAEVLEREREIYKQQALEEGKPANIVDKIADGKISKFYETSCLLEQAWIRDGDKKIKDLIVDVIAKIGENIVIGGFSRFSIGE